MGRKGHLEGHILSLHPTETSPLHLCFCTNTCYSLDLECHPEGACVYSDMGLLEGDRVVEVVTNLLLGKGDSSEDMPLET